MTSLTWPSLAEARERVTQERTLGRHSEDPRAVDGDESHASGRRGDDTAHS